jgi:mannose-6-phosphate isomerase
MATMDCPQPSGPAKITALRFYPWLRPMVWGGNRLGRLLGKPLPGTKPCGESWEVSDHPLHRSVVASGPWQGQSLRHLMEHQREPLLGKRARDYPVFPWLIKFLDADDRLSVQVHPDEATARRLLPGEGPKTEGWLVLDAAPGGRIWAGLLPGVDEKRFRAALDIGQVADCLHSFHPSPGDCIYLPGGTVHAVGGGVLLAEVQQTSDATFRLFDWDRRDAEGKPRPLHIEEGLASIHWRQGPVTPMPIPTFTEEVGADQRLELVRCPFFHLDYVAAVNPLDLSGQGSMQALIVLRGQGKLSFGDTVELLMAGQTWVFPACMPTARLAPRPHLSCLVCTLP